jgi:hypothetical protein
MLTEPTRSKGLRKFIPQPDRFAERYGRFTLTARDFEILDLVCRYRYVEARHVRALIGGSDQQITRRLQGLFHNGYLGRYARRERMRLELDPGAPLMAYGLETRGARAITRQVSLRTDAGSSRWKKDHTRRTEWFLEHHLMISGFRCVLELAVRKTSGTKLLSWSQGKSTWFQVRIPGPRHRVVNVAPDAHFILATDDDVRHYFLEADRSTEEHSRLVDKYRAYWWHLQDPRFTDVRGGRTRVSVLFVTTGNARAQHMVDTLKRMPKPNRAAHGGKGVFRFCQERDLQFDDPTRIFAAIGYTVQAPPHESF